MTLNVYAFTCGWLTLPMGLLLEGEKGSLTVPVPSYLVEHPSGRLVFDTGLHTDTQTDPDLRLGRLAPFHKVGFKPGEEIAARLSALGVDPGKIDLIVNSHLHFDHCGGNQQLPNATLLLQRREWDAAHNAEMIERVYYDPHDYDHGHRVRSIDGEHDACYLRRTLDEMHLPGAKFDAAQMIESLKRLRAMRDRGAMIITGHDPEMWETVPQAPNKLEFA
jgi:N-acyl homoserine lactone hydrolase